MTLKFCSITSINHDNFWSMFVRVDVQQAFDFRQRQRNKKRAFIRKALGTI